LTIQFQYTPEILQRAHELHYKKFFPLQGRLLLFLGLLSAWAGILLLIAGDGNNLWYGLPLILYGLFAVGSHYYMRRSIGKRAYAKLSAYHGILDIEISEANVSITVSHHRNEIPWADFKKALVTDEMVLLYPNDKVFFIFPKNRFAGTDYGDFIEMVERKIPKVV
jgi:hypothetical protein